MTGRCATSYGRQLAHGPSWKGQAAWTLLDRGRSLSLLAARDHENQLNWISSGVRRSHYMPGDRHMSDLPEINLRMDMTSFVKRVLPQDSSK
jgi:hypothetical protein